MQGTVYCSKLSKMHYKSTTTIRAPEHQKQDSDSFADVSFANLNSSGSECSDGIHSSSALGVPAFGRTLPPRTQGSFRATESDDQIIPEAKGMGPPFMGRQFGIR